MNLGGSSVLPVTWISFTAALHDHDAILKWITADEYHVEDYEIEQSYDGVTYSPVGRIAAKNMQELMNMHTCRQVYNPV